ncbi:hypothetical protein CPAR01_02323 [Colletotrichum paranaense]|uniref:Uncharacterized protein n=1 Tax=Colletotrichum paranaense TaxID=1914294 RepID=A0ABQ9T0W9_9PEZI|nr:uncharacterized protein CPAR01_02323 [Colletotrichum paranaense]KAK1544821.1 hypothetical protein CPAR01_02323 [Colletotrichum paranaense]
MRRRSTYRVFRPNCFITNPAVKRHRSGSDGAVLLCTSGTCPESSAGRSRHGNFFTHVGAEERRF